MRDLNADLAVCETATVGPWGLHDAGLGRGYVYASIGGVLMMVAESDRIADARLIATAREGWPEAIRRAIASEGLLHGLVDAINRGDLRQVRMSSGTDYAIGSAKRYLSR